MHVTEGRLRELLLVVIAVKLAGETRLAIETCLDQPDTSADAVSYVFARYYAILQNNNILSVI